MAVATVGEELKLNVLYHMYMGLYINFTINLLGPMDFQLGDGESSLPNDIVML